ncbi:hypothetical protein J6590_079212 [Homalodisca vitripennis]|nr:hypothetical protein J6590_079212 [Homalodisca vitripennis]
MDDNGLVRIGDANQGSRKKAKTASVRALAKLKRHGAPLGCRVFQPCKHLNKGVKCALVRPKDALNTRQVLYKEAEKNKQDGIIASWIKPIFKDFADRALLNKCLHGKAYHTRFRTSFKRNEFATKIKPDSTHDATGCGSVGDLCANMRIVV